MKILLLEPDEYYQAQLLQHLGSEFEIVTARDRPSAENLLHSNAPDMLVSELLLIDGPSFEFLEQVRRDPHNATLPIIIYSQIDTLPDITTALTIGVNGYLVKGRDHARDVKKLLLNLISEARI